MRRLYPRGTVIADYITRESHRLQSEFTTFGAGPISPAAISTLFVDEATVRSNYDVSNNDVMTLKVRTEAKFKFNQPAKRLYSKIRARHVEEDLRGGAPHHKFPTKRIARWRRNEAQLINHTAQIYATYRHVWRPKLLEMLEYYRDWTFKNMDKAESDGTLIVGTKPPSTSTGYQSGISNRGDFARNWEHYKDEIIRLLDSYYDDMMAVCEHWPEQDILIDLESGIYKGIMGKRDDGDVIEATEDSMIIESGTREVGNTPDSVFYSDGLYSKEDARAVWERFATPIHLLPQDVQTHLELLCAMPIGNAKPGDTVIVSLDWGWVDKPPKLIKDKDGKWTYLCEEEVKFGADNIVQTGVFLRTMMRRLIAMLKSGAPFTTVIYLVLIGWIIYSICRDLGYNTVKIAQIGDDIHLIGEFTEVTELVTRLGNWARLKGYTGTSFFAWGTRVHRETEDTIWAFTAPRIFKTDVAANVKKAGIPVMTPGTIYRYTASEEAREEVARIIGLYPEIIEFEGPIDEYRALLKARSTRVARIASGMGIAEWRLYYLESASADDVD